MKTATIIADDKIVVVDGIGAIVDLSGLASDVHAVQWNAVTGRGWVEYKMNDDGLTKPAPTYFNDITPYNVFLDRYDAVIAAAQAAAAAAAAAQAAQS